MAEVGLLLFAMTALEVMQEVLPDYSGKFSKHGDYASEILFFSNRHISLVYPASRQFIVARYTD